MSAADKTASTTVGASLVAMLRRWETALLALLVGVIVLNSMLSPYFLDLLNLIDNTLNFSEKAIIALPLALLIIAREIDVSVASIVALAATGIGLAAQAGLGVPGLVLVGLAVGAAAGLVNGTIVNLLGIHSIVVTIGTMSLYRGIVEAIVEDGALQSFPDSFFFFGRHYIAGWVPFEFALYVALTIAFAILLHATFIGRHIYAIGNNPEAARFSGIPVPLYRAALFTVTGMMCGLAAVLLTSRIGSVRLNIATGWELQVITMVVLGGVSIMGGVGSILGVTIAVLLIGLVTFGLQLINVPGVVINVFLGLLLIGAIAVPTLLRELTRQR